MGETISENTELDLLIISEFGTYTKNVQHKLHKLNSRCHVALEMVKNSKPNTNPTLRSHH